MKRVEIKHHDFEYLVGSTINSISVEEIEDDNENTIQVIRIDHSRGTHWIAPYTSGKKKKNTSSIIEVMVHEQYAECFEPEPDE